MKTNKFWSIYVMLVLALSSTFALTSCGSDDDDSGNGGSSNSITINGKTYKLRQCFAEEQYNGKTEVSFDYEGGAIGGELELKFAGIPSGDAIAESVELEYEFINEPVDNDGKHPKYEGKAYNVPCKANLTKKNFSLVINNTKITLTKKHSTETMDATISVNYNGEVDYEEY